MGQSSSKSTANSAKAVHDDDEAYSRFVPESFAYPADPIDLKGDLIKWRRKNWRQPATGKALGSQDARKRSTGDVVYEFQKHLAQIRDPDWAEAFLEPAPSLPNPLEAFPECQRACERLLAAARNQEAVMVFGDYDCDGVVSVTLIYDVLRALNLPKHRITTVIPHRIEDGYGLNWKVVCQQLEKIPDPNKRPRLVVSVDSGSTAFDAVKEILNHGLDLIIVDHHDPDHKKSLPETNPNLVHINPKMWLTRPERDARYQMENMCASGMAYLLARALIAKTKIRNAWSAERALLLAGMATCVDVMKLTGINRSLLKHSLRLANNPSRLALVPGLAKLKSRVGPHPKTRRPVTETTYGFFWGPTINAAGRMDRADTALKLLQAPNLTAAGKWVNECLKLNRWRKATELAMVHEAELMVEEMLNEDRVPVQALWKARGEPGEIGPPKPEFKQGLGDPVIVSCFGMGSKPAGAQNGLDEETRRRLQQCEEKNCFGCAWYAEVNRHQLNRPAELSSDRDEPKNHRRVSPPVLVLSKPDWHPGVVGIVAARIKEKFLRPTIVSSVHPIAANPGSLNRSVWRGSARSLKDTVKECHIGRAFHEAADEGFIERGGGHLMAGGLSFNHRQQQLLPERLAHALGLKNKTFQGDLRQIIEMAASASEFEPAQWAAIFQGLAPFGNGNPCPPLIVEAAELLGVRPVTRARLESLKCAEGVSDRSKQNQNVKHGKRQTSSIGINGADRWDFQKEDFKDPRCFMERLQQQKDLVSKVMAANLDSEARTALLDYPAKTTASEESSKMKDFPVPPALLTAINRMMKEPNVFLAEHFKGIILRLQTRDLMRQTPTKSRRAELNRYFLEDAFPSEIVKLQSKLLPQVWGYRGIFLDKLTNQTFLATWTDLEAAEVMWQVHRFLETETGGEDEFRLPNCFRLHLELRAYVPAGARSKIYQGKQCKWEYGFQIRQCVEITRNERFPELMRMPVLRDCFRLGNKKAT